MNDAGMAMNSEPDTPTSDWMSSTLERFEGRLLRYAQRIVGDHEEARDVVQETFLKLCRQDPAQLNGRLAQWLYTVCRNRALDVRRRRAHFTTGGDDGDVVFLPPSREPAPSEVASQQDTLSTIYKALTRLPSRQQECIRLKFQDGLSYREISEVTGLSVSNVGFLIHTGLKTARESLKRAQSNYARSTASMTEPRP